MGCSDCRLQQEQTAFIQQYTDTVGVFYGRKPGVSNGVWSKSVHVPKLLKYKLDPLSQAGTFLGYEPNKMVVCETIPLIKEDSLDLLVEEPLR